MDKKMQAISNLIKTLMDAYSDMMDIITSKSPQLFSSEDRAKILVNQLYVHQALDDVKKHAKDIT